MNAASIFDIFSFYYNLVLNSFIVQTFSFNQQDLSWKCCLNGAI